LSAFNRDDEQEFWKHAEWVIGHLNPKTGGLEILFDWDIPVYGKATAPWLSCITQGMALSVLARTHWYTNLANAVLPFGVLVEDGGLLIFHDYGYQFQGMPSKENYDIINESLFALIGIYEAKDSCIVAKSMRGMSGTNGTIAILKELAKKNLRYTERRMMISDFDVKLPFFKWSRYDDGKFWYSGRKYHDVEVQQLEWLCQKTGSYYCQCMAKTYKEWSEKYTGSMGEFFWLRIVWRLYGKWLRYWHKRGIKKS